MRLRFTLLFGIFLFSMTAQEKRTSIHEEESIFYRKKGIHSELGWDSIRNVSNSLSKFQADHGKKVCTLNKRVYGWHPYWVGTAYTNYDWTLLSDLCYFSYDADPSTGNNTNGSFAWSTSGAVTAALNNGVNAHFCVTLFSGHSTFWGSSTAQQTLITNIINLLQSRGGKGVNIDFEGMGASDKIPFNNFMQNLSTQLHAAIPGSEVSTVLYAVDWGGTFDIPTLKNFVDYFIIMGYDYYYSGSTTAGPNDPLYQFGTSYNYTLSKSVTFYLSQGLPTNQLILGLPYYGREYTTTSNAVPGSVLSPPNSTSRTFSVIRTNASGNYSAINKYWNSDSYTPYYLFQSGGNWKQCFHNDAYSLGRRMDLINQRSLLGMGIWALGYDDGYTDYWDKIAEKFTSCSVIPCTDSIFDMGGPNKNYYDKEDYTYTIAPSGASNVSLSFSQFDVELNFDFLSIYDGNSIAAPLIGTYTGTNSPGIITSSNGALTLRFTSDNATVKPGFKAVWTCINDNVIPTTQVSAPSGWITQNFTANFTDSDNINGSGVEKKFYQILEYNGSEWRANQERGFFSDNFDLSIHPDWTIASGNWAINSSFLEQNDENLSNTNIYAKCNQMLSNRYLYHWQGKIEGIGTNRRAGFHFFCDSASYTNRKNSYFVWFRPDQSSIEIYKVVNDVFTLQNSTSYTFTTGIFYDFKVTFDRISGEIKIWINDVYSANWTDPSPHLNGNYISFRNGNSKYTINDLKIYRSRTSSLTINVGVGSTNDIRFENTSPAQPAARIKSIIKDSANNLSTISFQDLNVDWTDPLFNGVPSDGLGVDSDTTFSNNQLVISWFASVDTNSAISAYEYAIGTAPGLSDVVNWTNNGISTSATINGLNLTYDSIYYASVRSINGAGLICDSIKSDGIRVVLLNSIGNFHSNESFIIYPNPTDNQFTIMPKKSGDYTFFVENAIGQTLMVSSFRDSYTVETNEWPKGIYIIKILNHNNLSSLKLIKQ